MDSDLAELTNITPEHPDRVKTLMTQVEFTHKELSDTHIHSTDPRPPWPAQKK